MAGTSTAFYYGIPLSDEEMEMLFKQVEDYKPPEEYKDLEGFDEAQWYAQEFKYRPRDELWDAINDLVSELSEPVLIVHLLSGREYSRWEKPRLIIKGTFQYSEDICKFDLDFDIEEWDRHLKAACERLGLVWRKPEFHVELDLPSEYNTRKYSCTWYLYYGITYENTDLRMTFLPPFVKQLFQEYFRGIRYHSYMKDIFPKISPKIMQEYEATYDEETADHAMPWAYLENLILNSEDFRNWMPDDELISDILSTDVQEAFLEMKEISRYSNGECLVLPLDEILVSTLHSPGKYPVSWLAIKGTTGKAFSEWATSPMTKQEWDQKKQEWDLKLKTFCEKSHLKYERPSFCLVNNLTDG